LLLLSVLLFRVALPFTFAVVVAVCVAIPVLQLLQLLLLPPLTVVINEPGADDRAVIFITILLSGNSIDHGQYVTVPLLLYSFVAAMRSE
jgi:hypothetical protein